MTDADKTADFIFEITKDIPRNQMGDSDAMNSTAGMVFGAASIVLGLALAGGMEMNRVSTALLLAALAPYLVVALATFSIISVQKFHGVVDPQWLWDKCKGDDVESITRMLAKAIPQRVAINQGLIHSKVIGFRWALGALALETALLVIAVAVSHA